MKKLIFASLLLVFASVEVSAQDIRVNGYAGYVFDDAVDSYYSNNAYFDGKINGGFRWGVGLEYMIRPEYGVELSYLRQDTKAPITYLNSGLLRPEFSEFDVALNWIMLGGNRYLRKPGGRAEGFFGASLGVAIINADNPNNGNENSATKFAWGIKGGVNLWATETVGIKLQADLMSAVQAVGGGFYIGTGGAGAGLSSYSSLLQFGLGGGLVFKLGGTAKK
jgi:hypothetical protein